LIPLARAAATELLAAGLLVTGYVVATGLLPRASTLLHWVGVTVSVAWIASAIFHLLSSFGAFRLVVVLASVALFAALASSVGQRQRIRSRLKRDLRCLGWLRQHLVRSPNRSVTLAISLLLAIVVLRRLKHRHLWVR
jgi:uncharacterized membrane protein